MIDLQDHQLVGSASASKSSNFCHWIELNTIGLICMRTDHWATDFRRRKYRKAGNNIHEVDPVPVTFWANIQSHLSFENLHARLLIWIGTIIGVQPFNGGKKSLNQCILLFFKWGKPYHLSIFLNFMWLLDLIGVTKCGLSRIWTVEEVMKIKWRNNM